MSSLHNTGCFFGMICYNEFEVKKDFRGMAQLVARSSGGREVASSSLVAPIEHLK